MNKKLLLALGITLGATLALGVTSIAQADTAPAAPAAQTATTAPAANEPAAAPAKTEKHAKHHGNKHHEKKKHKKEATTAAE
jgi:uncharacterized protein YcfJ